MTEYICVECAGPAARHLNGYYYCLGGGYVDSNLKCEFDPLVWVTKGDADRLMRSTLSLKEAKRYMNIKYGYAPCFPSGRLEHVRG